MNTEVITILLSKVQWHLNFPKLLPDGLLSVQSRNTHCIQFSFCHLLCDCLVLSPGHIEVWIVGQNETELLDLIFVSFQRARDIHVMSLVLLTWITWWCARCLHCKNIFLFFFRIIPAYYSFIFWFFKTGFFCVALIVLEEFSLLIRLVSNSQRRSTSMQE